MSTHETITFRPVSYGPRTERPESTEIRPSPPNRRSTVHFDDNAALHVDSEPTKRESKPAPKDAGQPAYPVDEACSKIELTAVDKTWGQLFELDGAPTLRLREVMHSLARYILQAFPWQENLVLVPSKLASFYSFHSVRSDPFQYQSIFQSKDKDQNRKIAELYQDLGCSYHLVQAGAGSRPYVPGLTPDGFTRWMSIHLQAFPDRVFKRLDRIVSDFPLDVPRVSDGKTERLPKQLSRYLLPSEPDWHVRSLLQQAVKRHFGESVLQTSLHLSDKTSMPRVVDKSSCQSPLSVASSPSSSSTADSNNRSTASSRRQDYRTERCHEHVHRASDPGTMAYKIDKLFGVLHRRHTSYSGPQSELLAQNEPVRERCARSDHNERKSRHESRRPRPPSRSHTYPFGTECESKSRLENDSGKHHSHHHHHHRKDSERCSSSRDSSRHSTGRSCHAGHVDSTTRPSKYPPSPPTLTHASSTSGSVTCTIGESTRPIGAASTSARRGLDPKVHASCDSFEIHHTDHYPAAAFDHNRAWNTKDQVKSSRRASCIGLPNRDSVHSTSFAPRNHTGTAGPQETAGEQGRGYCMERRASGNGEDRDYRLYTHAASSSAQGRHLSSTSPNYDGEGVEYPPITSKACHPSTPPARLPRRPAMSLCATVTTLEDELAGLAYNGGQESDFVRSGQRVAFVS